MTHAPGASFHRKIWRVLDICGAEGGATAGYQRKFDEVYVIDMEPRFAKRNPAHGFLAMDGLIALFMLITGDKLVFTRRDGTSVALGLDDFDFIHVSPPCQGYTRGNAGRVTSWPKLIPDFRELLEQTGKPWVIENVKDAGPEMRDPITLCGCMFSLGAPDADGEPLSLLRPRLFEASWNLEAPRACDHSDLDWIAGAYGGARKAVRLPWEDNAAVAPRDRHQAKFVRQGGYVPRDKGVVAALLGMEHEMTWNGLYESLPPIYTEWVALSVLTHIFKGA